MNLIALLTTLVLSLTGLWPHISDHARRELTAASLPSLTSTNLKVVPAPIKIATTSPNLETNSSVYAVDLASGQELFAQNATTPRPIASVTKLMTVMVALGSHKPDDVITVGKLPPYLPEDETMGLRPGEQFHFIDLLKAALIPSDNDAADALALATSPSLSQFAAAMNAKATKWGIAGAHFNNASGLIDTGNTVSAAAVARIAELDLANPLFREIIATPATSITDLAGRSFSLTTTNDLLATGQFYGIKTGYTEASGQCFVGLTKVSGHDVITVVLGSSDRFGETQSLVNWIGQSFLWP